MQDQAIALEVIERLDQLGVLYMVVGSLSSNVHGIPRATHDADFVLQLGEMSFSKVLRHLEPRFQSDHQLRFEGVTGTKRHILTLKETDFKVELFALTDDPFDQSRFARRCLRQFLGRDVYLQSPEDVIVQKLKWLDRADRPKDREDIASVIGVRQNTLDWDYIHHWCDLHETRHLLDEIRANLPPMPPLLSE